MALMLTWNMQGGQGSNESKWANLTGRITNPGLYNLAESPTIIFLQECSDVPSMVTPGGWAGLPGAPANVTRGSKNFGTYNNPKCYFVVHYNWGNNNNRVSYAVLISTHAIQDVVNRSQVSEDLSGTVVVHNPVPAAVGTRPIIGVTVGTATYYSMHAPSGVAAGFSRTYVNGMITAAMGQGDYVIGGDFNCEPNNLYTGLDLIPNGQLNTSGQNTYFSNNGNREYDYFTSNDNVANNTRLTNVALGGGLLSDHASVVATYGI
jgi:hypothetical protein